MLFCHSNTLVSQHEHACSCRHMLQISVQFCPSVETPPLASSLSPHSLQNCLTYFQVIPHHSSIISFIHHSSLCSFRAPPTLPVLSVSVSHMSAPYPARGVFRSAGPAIWNSLPLSVTSCSTIHTFKKQLKTHLFASAFPSSWIVLDAPPIRWSPLNYLSGCLMILCMPKCMLLLLLLLPYYSLLLLSFLK